MSTFRVCRYLLLSLHLLCGASLCLSAKPKAPDWVTAAITRPSPMDYGDATTAVLLDQAIVDVAPGGLFTRRTRWVEKILTRDGRSEAIASVGYNTDCNTVRSFQAWLISPKGEVKVYGKKETIDMAAYASALELYGEARRMAISTEDDAVAGAVFAYESVVDAKEPFTQEMWSFQGRRPTEYSGITYNLPPGWKVSARIYNHEPFEPIVKGRSYTWELRQLPPVEKESMAPRANSRAAIDIQPPPGVKTIRQAFFGWSEISTYLTSKYDTAAVPNAEIKAKADALVAGISDEWQRICRLARYAQNVNYIAINMNASQAGGLFPRPATRVFQCNYGDCKDKATMLRALLRTQGIVSYPAIVSSGGGRYIITDWPSPLQFNHCILAIKVDESLDVPAAIHHPKLGKLVLFDPTNPHCPPGWLPEEDSDGSGLLVAGSDGDLVTLPTLKPDVDYLKREITAQLGADGSLKGVIKDSYFGSLATEARANHKGSSPTDYQQGIERWLGKTMPTCRVVGLDIKDDFAASQLLRTTTFATRGYGKPMRDVLLVFKPVMVSRSSLVSLKKEKRTLPVVLSQVMMSESSTIEIPEGFAIDEMPKPVDMKMPFGSYRARVEKSGDRQLRVERAFQTDTTIVPVEDYEKVRSFFEKVIQMEQTPVVLKRI